MLGWCEVSIEVLKMIKSIDESVRNNQNTHKNARNDVEHREIAWNINSNTKFFSKCVKSIQKLHYLFH